LFFDEIFQGWIFWVHDNLYLFVLISFSFKKGKEFFSSGFSEFRLHGLNSIFKDNFLVSEVILPVFKDCFLKVKVTLFKEELSGFF